MELVAQAPNVILAASGATVSPLLQATRSIPIVTGGARIIRVDRLKPDEREDRQRKRIEAERRLRVHAKPRTSRHRLCVEFGATGGAQPSLPVQDRDRVQRRPLIF
jgi:hypothetical protein